MSTSALKRFLLGGCLFLLCAPAISQAQMYRWVDDRGEVHYSNNKNDAGKFPTTQIEAPPPPAQNSTPDPGPDYWREQEIKFEQRRLKREAEAAKENKASKAPTTPQPLSSGVPGDTDESKCKYAKDILSGAIKELRGGAVDDYDRNIAEREVQTYCK